MPSERRNRALTIVVQQDFIEDDWRFKSNVVNVLREYCNRVERGELGRKSIETLTDSTGCNVMVVAASTNYQQPEL